MRHLLLLIESNILIDRSFVWIFQVAGNNDKVETCIFCNQYVSKVLLPVSKLRSTDAVGTTMFLTMPWKRLVSRITFASWLAHTAATGAMRITMTSIYAVVLNLIPASPIAWNALQLRYLCKNIQTMLPFFFFTLAAP